MGAAQAILVFIHLDSSQMQQHDMSKLLIIYYEKCFDKAAQTDRFNSWQMLPSAYDW